MKQLIKLEQLLWLTSDDSEITLFHNGMMLSGDSNSISNMLNENILNKEITAIEAKNNVLKIWIVQ